jgi:hypothetical protein
MPALISQPLPAIAFARNEIKLVVKSVDYLDAVPVASINEIQFTGAVADGTIITLSWNEGAATMTAAAVPDDTGKQFPSGDGSSAYVASLVDWFNGNRFLSRDYLITLGITGANPVLRFVARKKGPAFNFFPNGSGNANTLLVTPGVTDSPKKNFMHHIQIWIQNDSGFEIAFEGNVGLDVPLTGETSLNIGDILQAYLDYDVPVLTGYWQACTKSIRKYYIRYAVFAGDQPFVNRIRQSDTLTVAFGGYSNLAFQQIDNPVIHLATYLLPSPSHYKFQRWFEAWPIDNLYIKTNQPQFFYFINSRPVVESFKIKVNFTYAIGNSVTIYLNGGLLKTYGKVCIGCGYKQLGLDSYSTPNNLIASYSIQLVNSVTLEARSLVKSFIIDRDYEEYTRYFLYADSIGNFKTLRTWGKSQLSAELSFDTAARMPDATELVKNGSVQNVNVFAVHNDKVNTGYISTAADYDKLIELHLSKRVYRVVGQTIIPITITSKNFDYSTDGSAIRALQLEYRLAYDDDLYTADSYALPIPQLNDSQQSINDI